MIEIVFNRFDFFRFINISERKKLIFISKNLLKIEKLLKNLILLKIGRKKRMHNNQIIIAKLII